MVPEAPLEQTDAGTVAKGDGWFVLNAIDSRWYHADGRSAFCDLEGDVDFSQLGINISVLEPGQPMAMYRWEAEPEDFLVLSGEAILVVAGEERPLRAWDFVHCPPDTKHVIVGAGDAPCVIVERRRSRQVGRQPRLGRLHRRRRRAAARCRRGGGDDGAATAYAGLTRRQPTVYRPEWLG